MASSDLRIAWSKGSTRLGASLTKDGNRTGFWNVKVLLKKTRWQTKLKKKESETESVSVNFIHAVCSVLSTPSDAGLALT